MASVVVDIQGAQSVDHRDRGIARYVTDLACGLAELAPAAVAAFSFNPDLPLPGRIEPLVASGKLTAADEVDYEAAGLLHVASPIELAVPFERVWPRWARRAGLPVAVTLFDLIPELFPDRYLSQPGIRRRYRTRLELVRGADRILAISQATAADAHTVLGVDPARVDVIPLAPPPVFTPPADVNAARAEAVTLVPGLRPPFVLYNGGQDFRKNMEALVEAWALVPERLRDGHQLVLACALDAPTANHFAVEAGRLGFERGLLLTGFVEEPALVALNQAASLVVFPSLYEGFGLPVVEALACGTPVVGADASSVPELLPPAALFDPTRPDAIATAIVRGLTDDRLRAEVLDGHRRRTARDVVEDTLAAYERVSPSGATRNAARRRPAARPRVAFCTPLPPVPGGVSDFSARLLETLPDHLDVEVFVDAPPHHRERARRTDLARSLAVRPLATLRAVEAASERYDAVLWTLGNSEYHTGALEGLLRRGGLALAHEVRLSNLYRFARWQHPEAVPGGFHETLHRMYPSLPPSIGAAGGIDPGEADRWGIFMARDAIAASSRFFVTSPFAAELARLDARRCDRDKVRAVPFAMGAVAGEPWSSRGTEADHPLVVSFGGISALKQTSLLVAAFAAATADDPRARLALVGATNAEVRATVGSVAAAYGAADRVVMTGEVDGDTYRGWLSQAWVAVQLRASTNGESSGAVGDCLSAGVPTIVTDIGAARLLPRQAVVAVAAGADASAVAAPLRALLGDAASRHALSREALEHARRCTYPLAARALSEAVREAVAAGSA